MRFLKGIYQNGSIEFIEPPGTEEMTEVVILFPELNKKIRKLGGLYKGSDVDYPQIKKDLKDLSRTSESHLLKEFSNDE
ncbi:MAG: hypothetical protein ACE5IR_10425 [bacterium]